MVTEDAWSLGLLRALQPPVAGASLGRMESGGPDGQAASAEALPASIDRQVADLAGGP